jgi:hypothetical protein
MKKFCILLAIVSISAVAVIGCGGGGAVRQVEEEFAEVKQMAQNCML